MTEPCPKCGRADVDSEKCPGCGVLVSAYRAYLEKLHRGPRDSGQPPGAAQIAAVVPIRTVAAAAPAAAHVTNASRRFSFHGDAGTLFEIQMVNCLLTIVTLGVYFFWGRVKVRGYLLSETELEGDRFEFHGTGRELLRGAFKALLIFGVPLIAVNVAGLMSRGDRLVDTAVGLANYGLVITLFAVAIVGARRYRLSRTSWRGIRFSFRGDLGEFIKLFVGGSFLAVLSFGLYVPIFFSRKHAYLAANSWFGNRRFGYDGRPHAMFAAYVKTLALAIPTLGLYSFWYLAEQRRYFWSHTTFAGARFRSTVTGGGLLGLYAVNFLVLVLTLGLAWPWVVVWRWRYRLDHLLLEGPLGLDDIVQQPRAASATAESIAGLVDVDFG